MSERQPPSDPFGLCGTTIEEKFRVVSVVGVGGFGVVYRGVHTGFGEPIAVKCLKLPGELDTSQRERFLTRLQDEGRVLHRLSRLSSGIVQALDVGAITTPKGPWVPYLVLEWLEGQTLADFAKERRRRGAGGMPLSEVIALLEPAASALAVAHEQKVAHRDVKPENIVLTEVSGRRTLKILDFGIAKVLTAHTEFTAAPAATQKSPTAFTPSYGAPEQFNKKRGATGPWTDVFALALIVVELATGERALDGDDATQLYIAAADPAARPTLRYRGVHSSDAVEAVLQRALAVDPHDRYADAGSFWAALREAVLDAPSATPLPDVSETGDFVSRNAIDLEPDALSKIDQKLDAAAAAAAASGAVRSKAGAKPERLDSDGVTAVRGQEPAAAASTRPGEAGSASAPTAAKPATRAAAPPSGNAHATPPAPARRATEDANHTTRFGDTLQPESGAGRRIAWWMPFVAVAALAGAGLLYVQLEREGFGGPDTTATGSSSQGTAGRPDRSGKPPPGPRRDGGATAVSVDGGSDAGDPGDASVDGSADGGDGGDARHGPPPEGMVYVPPADRAEPDSPPGFFIDRTEVTTAAYRECVRAGRCVQTNRVVLSAELADRIWGKPDAGSGEPTESPEQLARAWGKRCNEVRGALDHPINCVNHASAEDYCRFKGKRLPTSGEWAMAYGAGQRYPWGEARPTCGLACFGLNGSCVTASTEVATCPAGSHPRDRSPHDVLDLAGNVAEWVSDEVAPPAAHLPSLRMVQGGSFTDEADGIGSGVSQAVPPVTAYVSIGFRCAMAAPAGYQPPPP